jgi:hypothetical protein
MLGQVRGTEPTTSGSHVLLRDLYRASPSTLLHRTIDYGKTPPKQEKTHDPGMRRMSHKENKMRFAEAVVPLLPNSRRALHLPRADSGGPRSVGDRSLRSMKAGLTLGIVSRKN